MAPNEHLLDNFSASIETRTRGGQILRLAQAKTVPGSGLELRELTTGLPAACILIASEQLKNGDVQKKYAQTASCLKPKDFKRVYDTVQTILGEAEESTTITYDQLHAQYKSLLHKEALQKFITDAENEVMPLGTGYDAKSTMIKCAVYFWVLNIAIPKAIPATETFAYQHELPSKRFVNILTLMNNHCKTLRKEIKRYALQSSAAVIEPVASSSSSLTTASTPRRSPQKAAPLRQLPSRDSPKKPQSEPVTHGTTQETTVRRSLRSTPSIYGTITSLAKTAQPSTPSKPWKKGPMRALPSRDSPKKRAVEEIQEVSQDERMDVDEPQTPTKKRKVESPNPTLRSSTAAFLSAVTTPSSSRIFERTSPTKKQLQPTSLFPSTPSRSSPLKRSNTTDFASCSEDSELEDPLPTRRFRPIYQDLRQWHAKDPRLSRIWKRADKL